MLEESFSELELTRLKKLRAMEDQNIEPFPTRAEQTHSSQEAISAFKEAETVNDDKQVDVTLAGRIRALRPMGKIAFAHIQDRDGRIQLFFQVNELGKEKMQELDAYYDIGDFIQASGYMFRTRRGEVTLHVENFKMLAKALRPLPAAKDKVVDGEIVRHELGARQPLEIRIVGVKGESRVSGYRWQVGRPLGGDIIDPIRDLVA